MHCKDAPRYVYRKFRKSPTKQFLEIAFKFSRNISLCFRIPLYFKSMQHTICFFPNSQFLVFVLFAKNIYLPILYCRKDISFVPIHPIHFSSGCSRISIAMKTDLHPDGVYTYIGMGKIRCQKRYFRDRVSALRRYTVVALTIGCKIYEIWECILQAHHFKRQLLKIPRFG